MDLGVHRKQHHFRLDGLEMGKSFQGNSPANDGFEVETTDKAPDGAPISRLIFGSLAKLPSLECLK